MATYMFIQHIGKVSDYLFNCKIFSMSQLQKIEEKRRTVQIIGIRDMSRTKNVAFLNFKLHAMGDIADDDHY